MRPMFGGRGQTASSISVAFVSQVSLDNHVVDGFGLSKRLVAVKNCRNITKADMKLNDKTPKIKVDPETYQVTADGKLLTCDPIDVVPLAKRYFLF
jgi:urease subunit alpha